MSAANIIICTLAFSPSPLRCLAIWLSFFAFFRLKLLQSGRRFFVLRFNFILTKYSRSHLSRIALYSFASLISSSQVPIFCFSHSSHLFSLSYPPSFEIGLYSALRHRSHHFFRIFPICLRSFSFLLAIGNSLPSTSLFLKQLSIAPVCSLHRRSECFVHFNFLWSLWLPYLAIELHLIRKRASSLHSRFSKLLFFNLHFSEFNLYFEYFS